MKAKISTFLREKSLLFKADQLRFYFYQFKNRSKNISFQKNHPNFKFPPDYLMYESFQINYESYYKSGQSAAKWLLSIVAKYRNLESLKILDWGCGPARIIRHLPEILPESCEVFGTDYNETSINWNRKNIENVSFNLNSLEAKLPYKENYFDFIYGISIFTHLSEELHYTWKKELTRILKKDGILILSLQGDLFKTILTESESDEFEKGHLVVRGNVKEGHRTYSAFQPNDFVKKLFSDYEILEHTESYFKEGKLQQDIWVLKKL
ncbi:Ubiquinone/menaquinone biosynthesis C-methyltransferase UbiE [Chryseobacterium aquaeductus]|uniref:Ubiquinone/menaquinone biosynthesis C-methyltransferase UbiE n=1 Tax=Chryseobacterium aquaeductus TaxID=2675056 RepID=A0A9N8QRA8_9FLAO|nr:class I SAM-dependent methyltransferase [Chryseobacterium aquaeductus]CAA7329804.1 Ubiquinone/menaquinone biosynthesis C-methyltransferase UbiE [Chryseobacterium potabilaquae]CAD7799198.1 Ubiquinone/menaquinone biosynthesis C-methyltransferase UbiE [Chryseobacterium aquaeductus]